MGSLADTNSAWSWQILSKKPLSHPHVSPTWRAAILRGLLDPKRYSHSDTGHTRADYLVQRWYISTTDTTAIENYCDLVLHQYEQAIGWGNSVVIVWAYQALVELLVCAGQIQLITALDWSVDRRRGAEMAHGLKLGGFSRLEDMLWARYAINTEWPSLHLHKWPGNGRLMEQLSTNRLNTSPPGEPSWLEVGIGDKLYCVLEDILAPFLHPNILNTPLATECLQLVESAVKRKLRHRWFGETNASIGTWKQNVPFCDLNDIYEALRDFACQPWESLTHGKTPSDVLYKPDTFSLRSSSDFENDHDTPIDPTLAVILGLIQNAYTQTGDQQSVLASVFLFYERRIRQVISSITKARREIQTILAHGMVVESQGDESVVSKRQWARCLRIMEKVPEFGQAIYAPQGDSGVDNFQELTNRINGLLAVCAIRLSVLNQDLLQVTETRTHLTTNPERAMQHAFVAQASQILGNSSVAAMPGSLTGADLLGRFFKESFLHQVLSPQTSADRPNLNRLPWVRLAGFSFGQFTDIPTVYPKEKFLLITATRSDSHEGDETFIRDIEWNLDMLAPWGMLSTDGVRESFTRRYRIEQVASMLRRHADITCHVVVDLAKNAVVSLVFQKRHPNRSACDLVSISQCFDMNKHAYVPFNTFFNDPFTRVISGVRAKIRQLQGVDVFRDLQKMLVTMILQELRQVGIKKLSQQDNMFDIVQQVCQLAQQCPQGVKKFLTESSYVSESLSPQKVDEYKIMYPSVDPTLWDLLSWYEQARVFLAQHIAKQGTDFLLPEDIEIIAFLLGIPPVAVRERANSIARYAPLPSQQIWGIIESIMEKLLPILQNQPIEESRSWELSKSVISVTSALAYPPDRIHLFTRSSPPVSPFSLPVQFSASASLKPSAIPNNAEFSRGNLAVEMVDKKQELIQQAERLRKFLGYEPFLVLAFSDCATNKCLLDSLRGFFGTPELFARFVRVERVSFQDNPDQAHRQHEIVRHREILITTIARYTNYGWVIIGGWSWYDADDAYGQKFLEQFGISIMEALASAEGSTRMLGICLSHQIMMNALGRLAISDSKIRNNGGIKHRPFATPPIQTVSGALEFGMTPTRVDTWCPLFARMPGHIALAQTHSGHVLVQDGMEDFLATRYGLQPIATSTMTGLSVAYEALPNAERKPYYIGLQFHPEVSGAGVTWVMQELAGLDGALRKNFWVWAASIQHNFDLSSTAVTADAGGLILLRALNHLSESIRGRK